MTSLLTPAKPLVTSLVLTYFNNKQPIFPSSHHQSILMMAKT